jgi:hypothetical protein
MYLGPIATIGFLHNAVLTIDGGTVIPAMDSSEESSSGSSFSIGIEGGFKLAFMRLGAELGYKTWQYVMDDADVDLSGFYAEAVVGVGF